MLGASSHQIFLHGLIDGPGHRPEAEAARRDPSMWMYLGFAGGCIINDVQRKDMLQRIECHVFKFQWDGPFHEGQLSSLSWHTQCRGRSTPTIPNGKTRLKRLSSQ